MKRNTKKVVFLTSMIITWITLFAVAGKHHRFAGLHGCGQHYSHWNHHQGMKDSNEGEHKRHLFNWNHKENDTTNN